MSPRASLALGAVTLGALAVLAVALGRRANRDPDLDPRRSTFVTGPFGASGYAEALAGLGIRVEAFRRAPRELASLAPDSALPLLAVLAPAHPLDAGDAIRLLEFSRTRGDLLLAGRPSEAAMRCFGWSVERLRDSARVRVPGWTGAPVAVAAVLVPAVDSGPADHAAARDAVVERCEAVVPLAQDTVLAAEDGRPVALGLTVDSLTRITLVADGMLFSNRALRGGVVGPAMLRLVVGRYRWVLLDEYHQGFGPGGNAAARVLDWTARSPWGWALWQLAAVGLLALLAGGVRFGPVVPLPPERRRSPLEHVHALATALSAAGGHDHAIRLLVLGLRRRLGRAGPATRGSLDDWLGALERTTRTPAATRAAARLRTLLRPPQPAESVLDAAHAVEDVWQDLRPI